jgi:murein DD-endopeptidase MepM/ murein hydrolase activator NlpD
MALAAAPPEPVVKASQFPAGPVQEVMDGIVARLYAGKSLDELRALDQAQVMTMLAPGERAILAAEYWCFDANVPVVVSLLRDRTQKVVPFWVAEQGFKKTDLEVRNAEYTYEVWQKNFPAGRVGLGINGFEKHRPHYVVVVGPAKAGDRVALSNFFPADQQVAELRRGGFMYHDWPDLLLTRVPKELAGQILLPTIRGRAREAHLIDDAFRLTEHPAAAAPDQIALTWSGDPKTTQAIQWRSDLSADTGVVRWRAQGGKDWTETAARRCVIEDRMIANNPKVRHFTAELDGLTPGTVYEYTVGAEKDGPRSVPATFTTAPDGAKPFTFLWMSDTHNRPETGPLLQTAVKRWPDAAFLTVSGDNVGTGQYGNDWDALFDHWAGFIKNKPYMPGMGNHDAIDGLGPELILALFDLPKNGPEGMAPGRAYSLRYGNALLIMLDVTESPEKQAKWLEETLKSTDAAWKFAVFHFPPFDPDGNEPDIKKWWVPLFDQYHVDFALSGHVHHYLRTKPLRDGKVVDSPKDGTIYCVTISIPGDMRRMRKPEYAEIADFSKKAFCNAFTIDGNRCTMQAMDQYGNICDEVTVEK